MDRKEMLDKVSSIVAEIASEREKKDWQDEEMEEALDGLSNEEKRQALRDASCAVICVAMPGYMPENDNICVASRDDILDTVLEEIGFSENPDDPKSVEICDAAREEARKLGEKMWEGASLTLPGGYVLEINNFSCAEILNDMDVSFPFMQESPEEKKHKSVPKP